MCTPTDSSHLNMQCAWTEPDCATPTCQLKGGGGGRQFTLLLGVEDIKPQLALTAAALKETIVECLNLYLPELL